MSYGSECDVFVTREDNENVEDVEDVGRTQNDQQFLQNMTEGTRVTDESNVELPLPLKDNNIKLPINAGAVHQCTYHIHLVQRKEGRMVRW